MFKKIKYTFIFICQVKYLKKKYQRKYYLISLKIILKKKNNSYIFTKTSFKKAQFNNLVEPFCHSLKEYYHKSKLKYLERKINYKNFITIIRQICKSVHIPFTSKIVYDKSKYEIVYTIFTNFD